MSSDRARRHQPIVITILVALMLSIVPMPDAVESFRPDWVALMLIYWAMMVPRSYSVGTAWVVGILLDVAQGTLLGQHALSLTAIVFVTARFHLLMRVFPLSQLTLTVFALLALYQFLLFWINGVAGVSTQPIDYWAPVLTGTLIWPVLSTFLSGMRYRVQSRS